MPNAKRGASRIGRLPYGFIAVTILPALVLTLAFIVWPTINALIMSFTNAASMKSQAKFIGLGNYIKLFTRDTIFFQSLQNTLKLIAVVPIVTISLSLFFAFLFTQSKLRERDIYRVLFFLPSIVSMTVVGVVWACIFDPREIGIANKVVALFGIKTIPWFGDARVALWCIALVLVWQALGYYMVMHVAALDSVAKDIYEAADIDGAGAAGKLFRITLPLLKDTIGITFVLSLSGTINLSYVLASVMTNGGPSNSTLVLLQYMYRTAFGSTANFGYAMAVTVFSLALAFVLSTLSRRLSYHNENS